MTKKDLVSNFMNTFKNSEVVLKEDAEAMVNFVFDTIKEANIAGESVNIPKFGKFVIEKRNSRTVIHPQTREPSVVPEHNILKFKPAQAFKDAIK